ncbi:phosphatase PAP2 family protein [Actinomadura madurae]|uniref:phosphatase PAP2 family protein n=1 Tax=Actinomadura madurae TaxID=1993 RepID=UPI0020D2463C|nr:phosphatase PAP2 family protein [Actinomadura madurae]MCQ0011821.1 phosphatase PAP2 family protein [Actinomadura madurae]MCQ0012877.1 phosphatase PAP2 family protein [Actinomadura madurae]
MSLLDQPRRAPGALTRLRRPARPGASGIRPGGRPRPVRELLLIIVLFGAYKLGRLLANGRVTEAFDNAHRVWRLERVLGLPGETGVQHGLLHSEFLVHAANSYYAYVHFPATGLFLLWIYLRRPVHYRWVRRVIVALTAVALVLHLLVPLAPPRMMPATGLIDTAARFGPAVYGAPETDTVSNQYAAMPSLHIGWAAVIAVGLVLTSRARWRWLWLLHPVTTFAVVVATANHYWMDGVVVLMLLAVTVLLLRPPAPDAPPGTSRPAPRPASPAAR